MLTQGKAVGPSTVTNHSSAKPFAVRERPLLVILLVALVLRVVAAVALERVLIFRGGDGFIGPDDRRYDTVFWLQAQAWHGIGSGVGPVDQYLVNAYTYLAAGVYFVVGH